MENEGKILDAQEQELPEKAAVLPEQEGYKPRPTWQVWLARIGLVLFIVFLIVYYWIYFRGGR